MEEEEEEEARSERGRGRNGEKGDPEKGERRGIYTSCQTTLSLFAVGLGCVCVSWSLS